MPFVIERIEGEPTDDIPSSESWQTSAWPFITRRFGKRHSQPLAEQLLVEHGISLITKVRKNMRQRLLPLADKLLLRKRAIIESINDQLKNVCQIEPTRHRRPYNFLVHLLSARIAYCHQPKKPSLPLSREFDALPAT